MKLNMRLVPRTEMQQTLRLAPSIAITVDEVISNAAKKTQRELSDDVLNAVDDFVGREDIKKPYSDTAILAYVHSLGYKEVKRSDIAYARQQLRIKPASVRAREY